MTSKPEVNGTDQVKTASNDKAVPSDHQPPSLQPQQPAATSLQDTKAEGSRPAQEQDRSAQAEMPQAAAAHEAEQHAEVRVPDTNQDNSVPAKHEEKQPVLPVSPGNAQSVAWIEPLSLAKTPKRSPVRPASRGSERRPLEVMTLRTIELPDGRRITQLIPYRGGDRYRNDGRAMAFQPDE